MSGIVIKNDLKVALAQTIGALRSLNVGFCLVGGLAVSIRGEARLTRDIDLAISVATDQEAQVVVSHLRNNGFEVKTLIEQKKTGRIATVRIVPAQGSEHGIVVDLIFSTCGIEREIIAASDNLEILPEFSMPVAQLTHLIAMKLLSSDDRTRPRDSEDIFGLIQNASAQELSSVTDVIALISARGYSRGRDLEALWLEYQKRYGERG